MPSCWSVPRTSRRPLTQYPELSLCIRAIFEFGGVPVAASPPNKPINATCEDARALWAALGFRRREDMFTWLNKQGVRSSEGFEVQFTSRNTAEYREGHRYLVVDVEGGGNGFISFDKAAFQQFANSSERNSPEKQAQIAKNFMAAIEFQGLRGIP